MNSGFAGQWTEFCRGLPISRGGFIGRRNSEQQWFIERTADEVHADGDLRRHGADEARCISFGNAIPHFCREACRNGDYGKSLLAEHRPANRWPAVCCWLPRSGEFSWRDG